MPFAELGEHRIYFEKRGVGQRLLYIGGSGGDLRRRPNVFDSPLAEHFEILAYDQRGLGQTAAPDTALTMADYAEDAAGLLRSLEWESAKVVGVSFGGMVAQELALRHPDQVTRLVLACSSGGGKGGSSYPIEEFAGLPMAERMRRHLPVQDIRRDAAWQASHKGEFEALIAAGGAPWNRRLLESRASHDTFDRLPRLDMPVLICAGKFDGQAPPENHRAIHSQIPGSRLEFSMADMVS